MALDNSISFCHSIDGKEVVAGQGGLHFCAWITIHREFHGCMATGKHSKLEKR